MSHFLRITAVRTIGVGNTAVNTWHYSADGVSIFGIDDSAVVTQANAAITQIKAFYTGLGGTNGLIGAWTIGGVVTEHQTGQDTKYVSATPQVTTSGTGTVQAYQLAAVVSWRTGFAGRSNRGRTFVGPLSSTAMANQDISTAFVALLNSAASTLIAAPGVGHLVPAVYSPTHDTTRKITQGIATSACRTMRSRAA